MRPRHHPGGNSRRPELNPILGVNQPDSVNDDDIIVIGQLEEHFATPMVTSDSWIVTTLPQQ
jgi:hypothetical protein